MDTTKLFAALDEAIAQDRPLDETIFLRLLKEVWQLDWTVAPYDVWDRMMRFDIPYFLRFMEFDKGDEEKENTLEEKENVLIDNWIISSSELRRIASTMKMRRVIKLANHIRDDAR